MRPPRGDSLGDRMKSHEQVTRTVLPRRTYTVMRLDGRAFHSYTRGLDKPYDAAFAATMDNVAVALAGHVSGCVLGYVQSDEISLLLTDFAATGTQPWFDGEVQKMVSVAAGFASAALMGLAPDRGLAMFDARVFTLPDPVEVENYFIWRQRDCTRNSISMAAQAHFSHRELQGVGSGEMQDMLWKQRGVNWNDYPAGFKRGRVIVKESRHGEVTYTHKRTGEVHTVEVDRSVWVASTAEHFAPGGWVRERVPVKGHLMQRGGSLK